MMKTVVSENKSIVIRQKMKSAFTKVMLAARARGTAKEKTQMAFAALSEFTWLDSLEQPAEPSHLEAQAAMVSLALIRLSPACVRSAVTGTPQIVTVPNLETAEVFRAALAESAKQRASDRLIKIVVADH